jgi:hypothetical protein
MKIQTLLCHSALGSAPWSKGACHERHLAIVPRYPAQAIDEDAQGFKGAGMIHRVLPDGILIHDRNPSAYICFEVKARNEYFDLYPTCGNTVTRPGVRHCD